MGCLKESWMYKFEVQKWGLDDRWKLLVGTERYNGSNSHTSFWHALSVYWVPGYQEKKNASSPFQSILSEALESQYIDFGLNLTDE